MNANEYDTVDYLLSQLHVLKAAYIALVADRESLANVATELARALAVPAPLAQPDGFWIRRDDLGWMHEIERRASSRAGLEQRPGTSAAGDQWIWHAAPAKDQSNGRVPVFPVSSPTICDDCRWSLCDDCQVRHKEVPPVYEVVPFSKPFPVELMDAIISSADTQTISRAARTSLTCYELSMPILLHTVAICGGDTLMQLFGTSFRYWTPPP